MEATELNQFETLFLDSIEHLEDCHCGLRIRVRPGRGVGFRQDLKIAGGVIENVEQIVPEPATCLEIEFPHYATYSVRCESYWSGEKGDLPKGVYLELSDSYFLDYVSQVSFAADDMPNEGPLRHYMVSCLNHLIDVVAWAPPTMTYVEDESDPRPS